MFPLDLQIYSRFYKTTCPLHIISRRKSGELLLTFMNVGYVSNEPGGHFWL